MKSVDRWCEPDCPECFIIAEVAQAHEGSLGLAHAFIDAIAQTGVDAVKFQTHIAAAESTREEPFRVPFSCQDKSRYDYWKRMEFEEQGWRDLARHAYKRDLHFLSSPFSVEAVDLLERIGVPAWKVGSGEVRNLPLLERIASTRMPVLLSSGMSTWSELTSTVAFLQERDLRFAIFQTTSMYPTPPESIGLNNIAEIKKRFKCPVGLSDHSGTIFPSFAAFVLGARFIEIHVTLSRHMFGPDVSSSVTVEELSQLVRGIRFLEIVLSHPVDKDEQAEALAEVRTMFSRSVVPKTFIKVGKILSPEDLTVKKPGTGIPAEMLPSLYGKRAKRDLGPDEFFSLEDIET